MMPKKWNNADPAARIPRQGRSAKSIPSNQHP
jgi:hypothetical protein